MLRLKLKQVLREFGLSEEKLADAIVESLIEGDKPISERHLRYISSNTAVLTSQNYDKKPSLTTLGLIIRGLRRLTGKAIGVTDVLEYVDNVLQGEDSPRPLINAREVASKSAVSGNSRHALVHIPRHLEEDEVFEHVKGLVVQKLIAKGFPELGQLLEGEANQEARPDTEPRKRRRFLLTLMLTLSALILLTASAVFTYDRLLVRPRLLEARGGIFAFRDRVKATSSLPIPTLLGPEGTINQLAPELRVSAVPGALGYEFYVENLVSGDNVYTGPVSGSSFLIPEGTLCPSTPYAWRVRVLGGDGWTSFSSALEFAVSPNALDAAQQDLIRLARVTNTPATPVMVSPLGTAISTTPRLEVAPDPDVMGYGFYIRDLKTDRVIYNNNFALTNQVKVPEGLLEEGGIYQWNTRSRNCHYWSEFTSAQVFNVDVVGGG